MQRIPAKQITRILQKIHDAQGGHSEELKVELLELVYDQLRKIASFQNAGPHDTLCPTVLANDVYYKIFQGNKGYENRRHFFCAVAIAMKRLLIDHLRKKQAAKRGGLYPHLVFEENLTRGMESWDPEVLVDALTDLNKINESLALVVDLLYFAGRNQKETAEIMGVSVKTVQKYWRQARGWLHRRLDESTETAI